MSANTIDINDDDVRSDGSTSTIGTIVMTSTNRETGVREVTYGIMYEYRT